MASKEIRLELYSWQQTRLPCCPQFGAATSQQITAEICVPVMISAWAVERNEVKSLWSSKFKVLVILPKINVIEA